MAAPGPPVCACTNISIMQLFHELKQQFPTVPDCVVSSTISSHCHDRSACRQRLESEAQQLLAHAYPAASLQAAPASPAPPRPRACPNRLSDANQNLVGGKTDTCVNTVHDNAPQSQANPFDKCSDSEAEFDQNIDSCAACISDNKNYRISRISKVKCELNRKLEDDDNDSSLEDNIAKADDNRDELFDANPVRPKRPDSLRISPGIGYVDKGDKNRTVLNKSQLKFNPDDFNNCRIRDKSAGCGSPSELQRTQNNTADIGISGDSYPFNVSLNLSCRMDIPQLSKQRHSQTSDQIQNNFYSPGSYTSVNLTVCTPTSIQNFPMGSNNSGPTNIQTVSEQTPRGFEGNLQITVNSAAGGSVSPDTKMTAQPSSALDELPSTSLSENLVRRQKKHLDRLERALKADRQRLATMQREILYLQATPPPSPSTARLRHTVHQLHLSCEKLTQQLDAAPRHSGGTDSGEMSNANQQTGAHNEQRNADSERQNWKCHICTYINHADVNQCECCIMPRIILGRTGAPVPPSQLIVSNNNALDFPTASES